MPADLEAAVISGRYSMSRCTVHRRNTGGNGRILIEKGRDKIVFPEENAL
jgi:hypothetical protein